MDDKQENIIRLDSLRDSIESERKAIKELLDCVDYESGEASLVRLKHRRFYTQDRINDLINDLEDALETMNEIKESATIKLLEESNEN